MKATIKALLIVALAYLLAVVLSGCKEVGGFESLADDLQGNDITAVDAAVKSLGYQLSIASSEATASAQEQTTTVTLYFRDMQSEYLIPEARQVETTHSIERSALEELIKGPQDDKLCSALPPETRVLWIDVVDGVAYVSFSEELVKNHGGGSAEERATIVSVVNTLTEFDSINKVQFLVEGKVVETVAGHLDIRRPLARDIATIKETVNTTSTTDSVSIDISS